MNEKNHGKPFSDEAGEQIKIRAEGLASMNDLIGSVSADSDEWIVTATERFRGVVASEEQIPEIAYSLLQFLGSFAGQIKDPLVYLKLTLAINQGLDGLAESMKDIAEKRCKGAKDDGADAMAQMVDSFLKEISKEKQDEDGDSGVPDSGSC